MLNFNEVDKEYYNKFGKNIGIPINGFPGNITMQDFLQECKKCIEENREFDGEKFYGKIPKDAVE